MQSKSDYTEIPFDGDYRFMKSFSIDECNTDEVHNFFDIYGFVIFRNVLSERECLETIDDMWNLIREQNPRVCRDDPSTWNQQFTTKFGMPNGVKSLFRKSLLQLRQHPNVYQAFRAILKDDEIICSHDRWLMNRPTILSNGDTKQEWETPKNIHLDLNPFEFVDDGSEKLVRKSLSQINYGNKGLRGFVSENNYIHRSFGRCVQGILNLQDISMENYGCGGTIVVPGYHNQMEQEVHGYDQSQEVQGPMQYRFRDNNQLLDKAQRICLASGSLLIWDQRLAHGSTPNKCDQFRCAIPIRFFPSAQMDQKRRLERANAVGREIKIAGFSNEVTEIGKIVFGLN